MGAPGWMGNKVEELSDASEAAWRLGMSRFSFEWLTAAAPRDGKMLGSHSPSVLASSTKMISFRRRAGEACRTLYTVRSSVDQASLWKTMTTLVVGKGGHRLNFWSMHLRERKAAV